LQLKSHHLYKNQSRRQSKRNFFYSSIQFFSITSFIITCNFGLYQLLYFLCSLMPHLTFGVILLAQDIPTTFYENRKGTDKGASYRLNISHNIISLANFYWENVLIVFFYKILPIWHKSRIYLTFVQQVAQSNNMPITFIIFVHL